MRSSQQAALHTQLQLPRIFQGQKAPNYTNANQRAWCNFLKLPNCYNGVVLEALASLWWEKSRLQMAGTLHTLSSCPRAQRLPQASSRRIRQSHISGLEVMSLTSALRCLAGLLFLTLCPQEGPFQVDATVSPSTQWELARPGSQLTQQLSHKEGQPAGHILSPH